MTFRDSPHPLAFFGLLKWIDGRPLLDTIETYRREILSAVLYDFDGDRPRYNFALTGRGKKNFKTSDLILATLYRFIAWHSPAGNDCFTLANDEGQAADDLKLAKLLIAANPDLAAEVRVLDKEIVRRDGRGTLAILPAKDSAGAHGKTYSICGFDEIHAYKGHEIFEALAQDPTRHDSLMWITSYNSMNAKPGVPLFDFLKAGREGSDERMYFSWYAGDYTTDPALVDAETPEERANPSMASWGNPGYLAQQRKRLPTHRYRRLHLNLPGAPDGAAFEAERITAAVVLNRVRLPPEPGRRYHAHTDMSGGSKDDATLAIAYRDEETGKAVLASVMAQNGKAPFNPRDAIVKFAAEIKAYGLARVVGDAFAGETFRRDFEATGISYVVDTRSASELYETFEPSLNAGEVELLDVPKLTDQLISLIWKGNKITHQSNDHDDYCTSACGALISAAKKSSDIVITDELLERFSKPLAYSPRGGRHLGSRSRFGGLR
ncbi:hypothetical protein D3273_27010 [Lichenibacterium minor]|uniref:Terminase large subunit n=1 Tax=Lichenibacterium minor TaxID=2316528 RepID=A0A4Q2TYR7_9HYPH|nr:hypothetical protein [Lichenibacterium minor]RYC28860.1 hypothetical protein D3273_27010 [Lichenibacterium minor]